MRNEPIKTNEMLADDFLAANKINPKHRPVLIALLEEAARQNRRRMGHVGGTNNVKRLGKKAEDHFKKMGKKGGEANAAKYTHEHFVSLGKKGGAKVKETMALLRAQESAGR